VAGYGAVVEKYLGDNMNCSANSFSQAFNNANSAINIVVVVHFSTREHQAVHMHGGV
jgi:hypothetical protein